MYLPTPLHKQDLTQGQYLKQSFTDQGRIVGCIHFSRVLVLKYTQLCLGFELCSSCSFSS